MYIPPAKSHAHPPAFRDQLPLHTVPGGRVISDQPILPVWDNRRLRQATDAAGVALWSWNATTDRVAMDQRAFELWDMPNRGHVYFEDLSAKIHPHDTDRVRAAFAATRGVPGTYEIDFRVEAHGHDRWISARGQGDDQDTANRVMFGVFLDVTDRRQAEESREMVAGEMSHRVKNLFAVASALTAMAARSAATTTEMERDLTQRLMALGTAHDLVRPVPGRPGAREASLSDLLGVLLAPYDTRAGGAHRIAVDVPDIRVGEGGATAIALVIHELATNSIKYGALSAAGGTLDLAGRADGDDALVTWTERGGPAVTPPTGRGFGSKLVHRTLAGQLGGTIAFDWRPTGVVITLRMNRAQLLL